MDLLKLLLSDAKRHNPHKGIFYTYLRKGEYRYTFWLRCVHHFKNHKFLRIFTPPMYMVLKHMEYKFGIHMNTNIEIGYGLAVVHGGSVYVNVSSIGDNFTIFQDVTLGANSNGQIPVIKDNVRIYPGAKIFGNVTLNNNSIIGANAVVTKDVEANSTVFGVPANSKPNKNK